MTNLALVFPDLAPVSFRLVGERGGGERRGVSVDEHAARRRRSGRWPRGKRDRAGTAAGPPRRRGRDGLHARLDARCAAERRRLAPRFLFVETDSETIRDEIEGTVTSLLALVGIAADPLASREHVLLSNLIEHAWRGSRPRPRHPDRRDPGAADPQARRLRRRPVLPTRRSHEARVHAQRARGLPTFAAWSEGEPLDPQRLLFTDDGKPRCAVVYLAHLSEEERQFVVTLVFSRLVTWMRGQEGTPDLRALAYMDEVFGYVLRRPLRREEADPHDLQAGTRTGSVSSSRRRTPSTWTTRRWPTPGHGWSAGCRPENDKARARRPALGGRRDRRRGAGPCDRRARQAAVPARLREGIAPAPDDAVGDVVPLRTADEKEQVARLAPDRPRAAPPRRKSLSELLGLATADETSVTCGRRGNPRGVPRSAAPWATAFGAVAGSRLQAFVAARVSLRYDDSAAGVDEQQEFEAVYGRSLPPRPRERDAGRLRRSRLPRRSSAERRLRAARRAARRGALLPAGGEGDPAPPRRPAAARAGAEPGAEARLAVPAESSRTSPRVATPPPRSAPTPRRRRSATGSRRSATGSSRRSLRRSAAWRSSTRTRARARRRRWSRVSGPCSAHSAAVGTRDRWRARSAAPPRDAG